MPSLFLGFYVLVFLGYCVNQYLGYCVMQSLGYFVEGRPEPALVDSAMRSTAEAPKTHLPGPVRRPGVRWSTLPSAAPEARG
jgi:hypothetical protein